MRFRPSLFPVIIGIALVVALSRCDETENPDPESSGLEYIGAWTGTTQAMGYISFEISNVGEKAWITGFKLEVIFEGDGVFLEENISQGITPITEGTFAWVPQGGGYVKGYFISDTIAYGSFGVYNAIIGDTVKGNFLINNRVKGNTLSSHAQFNGKIGNLNLYLGQDASTVKTDAGQLQQQNYLTFPSWLKLKNQSTGGFDTLFQVKLGRLSAPLLASDFKNLVKPRSVNYANQAQTGIEVVYLDKNDNYKRWSSAQGSANQDSNTFIITDSQIIDGSDNTFLLYKIIASFNCTLYDNEGYSMPLTGGTYIGFVKGVMETEKN